jgi:hypothetical protein
MFPCILMGMWQIESDQAGIRDEDVTASVPFVRALVVQRLEQAWRACDPHIQVQVNPDTGLVMRPDPRFIEAGLRILDRLSSLYRLNAPQSSMPDVDLEGRAGIQGIVRAQIEEMENRS